MHGGNLRWARETYGLESFVDLSANINPFGPPKAVWKVLRSSLKEIKAYPDPEYKKLRLALSEYTGLGIHNIMVGNGAGELIFTIMHALKPKHVIIPIPSFSEYEKAAKMLGSSISCITLGSKGWGKFDGLTESEFIEFWSEKLDNSNLLFICSPHNPTGSVINKRQFEIILDISSQKNCRVLFDESFQDFLPENSWSARSYLAKYSNLIIVYSLTKFYSIPGLRLGACFASIELIKIFNQFRDPWTVNVLAERAGLEVLLDKNYALEVRKQIFMTRNKFYNQFLQKAYSNLRILPSEANFALIQVLVNDAKLLVKELGFQGILVRDCSNFEGLDGEFIRVAIKDLRSMKKLLDALDNIDWVK